MRSKARAVTRRPRASRSSPAVSSDAFSDQDSTSPAAAPAAKRRKTGASSASKTDAYRQILRQCTSTTASDSNPSLPPTRRHSLAYHKPRLLDASHGAASRRALLEWFDSVSQARAMPWRKPWLDPASFADAAALRRALETRAYEVWISEIMLQQTRVAVVVEYWNRWMGRWPTIRHLARADADDVLAAWRGLGYYSRATRIHEAARLVVADAAMRGLLPAAAAELAARIPGVGRYTAGAISCIAFGRPAPMVDGNVLRVLSRQLGIYGNVKTDRAVVDMIWAAAEELVDAVARDGRGDGDDESAAAAQEAAPSDRPGRWGQALMELGSTVCAPRPNCAECPITSTCRAYSEGLALSQKPASASASDAVTDMEDLCSVCEPFDETDDIENQPPPPPPQTGSKQAKLSAFFTETAQPPSKTPAKPKLDMGAIANHARRFPVKAAKKAVREEETLVCAIVRGDGRYLIHRRPAKGLLAALWEFPSATLQSPKETGAGQREKLAKEHVARVLGTAGGKEEGGEEGEGEHAGYVGELGSVPWLFSHIKLTMHVHLFRIKGTEDVGVGGASNARWSDDVDAESMGTGMRKCWDMVKQAAS